MEPFISRSMRISLGNEPQHRYRVNTSGMALILETVIDTLRLDGGAPTVVLDLPLSTGSIGFFLLKPGVQTHGGPKNMNLRHSRRLASIFTDKYVPPEI